MSLLAERLARGLAALNLDVSEEARAQLLAYLALLERWNRAYNLTSIREPERMLNLHILDSLTVVPWVEQYRPQGRIVDVGTGAGLPGLVVALACPGMQVTLLDANGKKCRFLNQVALELNLANIQVVQSRVETYRPVQSFDLVLSRAFATLADMTDNARHLLSRGGHFLAMKGRYPDTEIEQLRSGYTLVKAHRVSVPGLEDTERYLVDIKLENRMHCTSHIGIKR